MPFTFNPLSGAFDYYKSTSNEDIDDRVNDLLQDSTATVPGLTWTYDDTANTLTPTIKQSYDVFIYNSSGSQTGNRYSSWADLMVAIKKQEGFVTILFEQNETIPAGTWNLDYVTLRGNGLEYNTGGFTVTFGNDTYIEADPVFLTVHSLRIKSTSTTGHICSYTAAFLIIFDTVSHVDSAGTYTFFTSSASGQNIISLRNSARFALISPSTLEHFTFTGAAFSQQVIVSRGETVQVANNTLKSTNAVIYIDLLANASNDGSLYPATHTNLSIGAGVYLVFPDARSITNTAAGNIAATTVQAAINELDTEKVAKAGDTMTGRLLLAAGTASANTSPLKFQSGTNLTSIETGAVEYDGNRLYHTNGTAIREVVSGVIFSATADKTVANTTTETSLIGTGVGTLTLPANFWVAGKTVRIILHGTLADTGNPTIRLRGKLGSTTIVDSTASTLPAIAGTEEFRAELMLTGRSTGATGTVTGSIWFMFDTTAAGGEIDGINIAPTTTTFDTTASGAVDLTIQWGTADAANTITAHVSTVEVLN